MAPEEQKTPWDRRFERPCERFAQNLRFGFASRRADGDIEAQASNYRDRTLSGRVRREQTKELLNRLGVHTNYYIHYYGFSMHVDKLIREHDAKTLAYLVRMAIDRWLAMGLEKEILEAVCREVFGLEVSVDTE